jgi:tetratricopeptide (TPR) repeat protein
LSRRCLLAILAGICLGAAALRGWGPWHGELVWHPDEIFLVVIPLGLFSGDLNPHQFHYPSGHFYLLGMVYYVVYLFDALRGATSGLYDWSLLHGLFETQRLRDVARWVSVVYGTGIVGLTGLVAYRMRGRVAAIVASLAMAVCTVHVRQTQIASVDAAMAFWYLAVLAVSLPIPSDGSRRRYVLCGVFVGLCAATKYPGAVAGAIVLAAHLLSRRRLLDRRLWVAGIVSLATFSLVSPYVWLDFETFRLHFTFQVSHVETGTQVVAWPLLQHARFSLLQAFGGLALAASAAVLVVGLRRRDRAIAIVAAAFAAAYLAISWGQLVFVRYSLPLLPPVALLLGAGVAGAATRVARAGIPHPLAAGLLALALLASPAWASLRVAALSARVDTRSQARAWMERHVPPGSRCCNFGGWGGDIQVRTYQHLWWLLVRHEEAYGLERLLAALPGIEERVDLPPYFTFSTGGQLEHLAGGDWDLVDRVQCDHVLLHRHPLPSSRLDSAFVADLPHRGTRRAVFDPGPGIEAAVFDEMDAYYIPLARAGGIDRPGPVVEIWELAGQPHSRGQAPTVADGMARALGLLAMSARDEGDGALSMRALLHASRLNPEDPRALEAWGESARGLGRIEDAEAAFRQLIAAQPQYADGLEGLARLLTAERRHEEAVDVRQEAVRMQPTSEAARVRLAQALARAGHAGRARAAFDAALDLDTADAATHNALGRFLHTVGDTAAALDHLDQAIRLAPELAAYHRDAGVARHLAGEADSALAHLQRTLTLDAGLPGARRLAALLAEAAGDTAEAVTHWQALRGTTGADSVVAEGAAALRRLGRPALAAEWEEQVDAVTAPAGKSP